VSSRPDNDVARQAREAISRYKYWYHRIEVAPGVITPGINDSSRALELLDLPADLRGATVLDVGTRDGFFAFECERRGATVTAVDYLPAEATGFGIASGLLGSHVRFIQENVYKLDPAQLGTFDIVLMLGLLYHLRDPLGAIDVVRSLCNRVLYLETYVCDAGIVLPDGTVTSLAEINPVLVDIPMMRFCPGSSLNADPTNFWAPNTACVDRLLREALFSVEGVIRNGDRSLFHARAMDDDKLAYHRDIARGVEYPVPG
jgi:tRNA (mo5U34)-methyltransferase